MSSLAYRWVVPGILAVLFLGLVFVLAGQQARSWSELDASLSATLRIEAQARAAWLSERLDPFATYSDWTGSGPTADAYLADLTGASWLLLEASGEIAVNRRGEILFAVPEEAAEEVDWREDEERFLEALAGEESVGPARRGDGGYRKRIFVPVEVASGALSTRWVLVGQVGPVGLGNQQDSLFGRIFQAQTRFYFTAAPLALASLLFLILLFRGIARNSRLERTLREAEESIELESLTSTLAHELRNPLAIVQSCAEIVERQEALSPDGRGLVKDLLEELRRAQDVLTRHLHPERISHEALVELRSFSIQFWEHRRSLLATHRLELEMQLPAGDDPLPARAVPDRLERILDNLLRNSVEAMPGGGRIVYSVKRAGSFVEVGFADTGPGLGRELFFNREGWRVGSNKPQGRGIGLRLARKWLAPWGGSLTARNERTGWLGKVRGARLVIRLVRAELSS